jgi:hypothetical protein
VVLTDQTMAVQQISSEKAMLAVAIVQQLCARVSARSCAA